MAFGKTENVVFCFSTKYDIILVSDEQKRFFSERESMGVEVGGVNYIF